MKLHLGKLITIVHGPSDTDTWMQAAFEMDEDLGDEYYDALCDLLVGATGWPGHTSGLEIKAIINFYDGATLAIPACDRPHFLAFDMRKLHCKDELDMLKYVTLLRETIIAHGGTVDD